ncbi:arginine--tRNA ligase [Candidatus Woesebacteria bacterium RIFCSPLOWO2_01_FULL_39_23]|uniref:Arginine--tRNA ligase n=1 Tax=Candidatus Woesebacteria bacterium RIFCSPHIGHO2_01_FULL_40_22 TaxID=1802499 RepID=A0A1F7YIJ9_9BACT|nr:MAG: arginine--tRNA ligase [Candidatus Woesebacteria bacterium RBG_16_40_11]OGM27137.1 MAG: arginine--tRNA ligase [Candidatus Woesebacteria bacterium RIFCSPHIGHO2_01_FULL_40_22]OGM38358.1 MAG: arginine--tRNA ligase [Candidatus Woesebacteria bacterium RIFCSPHIGHO2_12_FULL_38_9]OGM63027.1 MAG: arginine--tRNA ligase [Candidatus Woesebacteria bacterium RIFCSPLOWO2_01_FULL_39_23]
MREKIIISLAGVTGLEPEKIQLEIPENEDFGDYSSNAALSTFENAKLQNPNAKWKNARDLAEEIVSKLEKDSRLKDHIDRIEVAGAGFINFWLTKSDLVRNLKDVVEQREKYGDTNLLKSKRINFEFGQPNTHKLPHIGHLFSYIYGSAMSNILEAAGGQIRRVNYQGDIGLHVAKCLWALRQASTKGGQAGLAYQKVKEGGALTDRVILLQKMYQEGSTAYDSNETTKNEINGLNKKIYEGDSEIVDLWKQTREWSIEYYKKFEERLGIKFDRYYFESEVHSHGKETVEANVDKIFKKSEGALIFEGSKYGLHDRVFVTNYGTPTYEAKDLYLEVLKYKEWPYDLLIITTAHEQNDYFNVIYRALEEVNPELRGKLHHIGFGMVNLKTGKMSSRTGEIIGAVELVNLTIDAVKKLIKEESGLSVEEKNDIAEKVGIGAIKYSFLKNNPLQDTKFDLEESIAKEGNSGPYIQYTYARTQSVRKKSKRVEEFKSINNLTKQQFNDEETAVMRKLVQFQDVIAMSAKMYSPNVLCNYLYDVAKKFNNFYDKHRILDIKSENVEERESISKFRIALTEAAGTVLKNGLNLLGIESSERM